MFLGIKYDGHILNYLMSSLINMEFGNVLETDLIMDA